MKKMHKPNKTAGGAREGAGRKQKYGEPTVRIFLTVPVSKKSLIIEQVESMLEKFKVKNEV